MKMRRTNDRSYDGVSSEKIADFQIFVFSDPIKELSRASLIVSIKDKQISRISHFKFGAYVAFGKTVPG